MQQLIKIYVAVSVFCLPKLVSAATAADIVTGGLDTTAKKAGFDEAKSITQITGNVINSALSLLGIIFLILLIYGGFIYLTAQGDDTKVKKAKSILTTAVIGIVIISAAYAISLFVIKELTGTVAGE
ncbi:hypothetical protein ACFLZY_00140 [Patescibacteria group bacterium]